MPNRESSNVSDDNRANRASLNDLLRSNPLLILVIAALLSLVRVHKRLFYFEE